MLLTKHAHVLLHRFSAEEVRHLMIRLKKVPVLTAPPVLADILALMLGLF